MVFKVSNFLIEQLGEKPLPPGVANVKHLEVRLFEFCTAPNSHSRDLPHRARWVTDINNFLARLIEAMPNLRSFLFAHRHPSSNTKLTLCFSIYDGSFEHESWPSQLFQQSKWLKTLKKLPKLKNVQFDINSFLDDVHGLDITREIAVKSIGFKDLTSLQLYNLQGPEKKILKDLTMTLRACPQLTVLGLGRSCDADIDVNDNVMILEDEIGLLEKLCVGYAAGGSSGKPDSTWNFHYCNYLRSRGTT